MASKKTILTITAVCAMLVMSGCENSSNDVDIISTSAANTAASLEASTAPSEESISYHIDYNEAEQLFNKDFWRQFDVSSMDKMCISEVVIGNRYYSLMASGNIYYFDANIGDYHYLTTVSVPQTGSTYQGKSYSDLDEAVRQERDYSVFQLIGAVDSDVLYGYSSTSGRIGPIDENGIHWNSIPLDNSLQTASDAAWPDPLYDSYIEGNLLYVYFEPISWSDNDQPDTHGQLWTFDMQTGNCSVIDLPQTYMFCPYKPGQMLLLRRAEDGRMYLSAYDLSTHAVTEEEFPELPLIVSDSSYESVTLRIGGLAFHEASDSIVCVEEDGIWQSAQGNAFDHIQIDCSTLWDDLSSMTRGWLMQNGSYVYPNSGKYLIYEETE